MVTSTSANISVPIQKTMPVTKIAECRCISRFEIKIHAIAANMDSTTRRSPIALDFVVPELLRLETAMSAAPRLEAVNPSHPPRCSLSPENSTDATASSIGSVPTINAACETVVSDSPLNCTRN